MIVMSGYICGGIAGFECYKIVIPGFERTIILIFHSS